VWNRFLVLKKGQLLGIGCINSHDDDTARRVESRENWRGRKSNIINGAKPFFVFLLMMMMASHNRV
jgi:hypothetical protein